VKGANMSRRSEQLQKKIEGLMEAVPNTPKGFTDWIIKSAFRDKNYMFYKRKGSKTYGLCSSCKEMVDAKKAKHNESGRCPSCKAKVTYKAINKAKHYSDSEIVSIIQKTTNGKYVVRYFKAWRIFKDKDTSNFPDEILETLTNPEMNIWEGSREIISILKNGNASVEEYEELWNWEHKQYEWRKEHKRSIFFNKELLRASTPFLYKRNLKGILKNTKWQYSGLDYFKGSHMNITNYLWTYERYPSIELLSKINLSELLDEVIYKNVYWGGFGNGLIWINKKMLGLNRNVFNIAVRLNLKTRGIEFVSTLDELGHNLKDHQIEWAIKNSNTETFTQLLKWISPQKLINYVEKNIDNITKRGFTTSSSDKSHFVTTWRDYIEQCEYLKMITNNDFILFPKDLIEKHAELTEIIESKEDQIIEEGIKVQYEKWNNILSYQAGNLRIEVARSHKLIMDEGSALRHCVGSPSYSKRMAKGKHLILFLRQKDKPYYTIEFDTEEMKIIQNRGLKNARPTKDVEKFINKWKVKKLLDIRGIAREAV